MCGINGIFYLNGRPVIKDELLKMNSMMTHRGPDDEGYYINKNIGLAMRRLSIIDVHGGHQPLTNEDGRYWIVFNGEIFNFVELRQGLQSRHRFTTNSDTEVIIHLYEEHGEKCLQYLNGMFTFAIWDNVEKELFIARDRLGVKPFFYFQYDQTFAFSSELKALIKVAPFQAEVDYTSFLLYIFLMYVPDPECIVKGIKKLEPGHFIKVKRSGIVCKEKYWDVKRFSTFGSSDESALRDELLFLLKDAIRIQKRSDVPIGTFLSGGLDSGTVVALLAEQNEQPVRTFSVGFEGHIYDERPAARIIAERFGTSHRELVVTAKMAQEGLSEVVYLMDEPVYDSAAVPVFLLSRMARHDGVKVILNGTGGDEIFGGYPRYMDNELRRRVINLLPRPVLNLIGDFLEKCGINFGMRMNNQVFDYLCRISGRVSFADNFLTDKDWPDILREKLEEILDPIFYDPRLSSAVSRRMYFDLKTYLVGDLLMLLDKMTMGASIEGRVPLLDHRLVEFMFSLSDHYKLADGKLKVFFRKTISDMLPDEVLHLPKRGFGAPVGNWVAECAFSGSSPWYETMCADDFLKEHIDIERAMIFLKSVSGKNLDINPFFGLTFFAEWRKQVIEEKP